MPDEASHRPGESSCELGKFARRAWTATLIVGTMIGGVLLLWLAFKVVLLFFAAVLLAIFLRTLADWVSRCTRLGRGWSLAITYVGLFCLAGVASWLLATPITNQVNQISEELPKATAQLENQLRQYSWGNALMSRMQNPSGALAQTGSIIKKAQTVFSISLEGIVDIWVIFSCGFYLAGRSELYRDGFLRLVPCGRRARVRAVLEEIAGQLRHWLFGQIVSMTIIGVVTWLGLFLLGIPASQVLGILAGLLDFVPVAGPWIAGVAACMIALLKSPLHAVYVACLFVTLHLLEGHLVIPLVQRQATQLPAALTVLAMVLFYTLFGFLGLLLAVPLLVVVVVATRAFYVEDILERSV